MAVAVAALTMATTAAAQFSGSAPAAMSAATATFAAPTAVASTQVNCKQNTPPQISTSWTASTSSFTTGYTIKRATASGGPYTSVASVAKTVTSYVDTSASLLSSTTYYYLVVGTYNAWTAQSGQTSITTLSNTCK